MLLVLGLAASIWNPEVFDRQPRSEEEEEKGAVVVLPTEDSTRATGQPPPPPDRPARRPGAPLLPALADPGPGGAPVFEEIGAAGKFRGDEVRPFALPVLRLPLDEAEEEFGRSERRALQLFPKEKVRDDRRGERVPDDPWDAPLLSEWRNVRVGKSVRRPSPGGPGQSDRRAQEGPRLEDEPPPVPSRFGLDTAPLGLKAISARVHLFAFPGADLDVSDLSDAGTDRFGRATTVELEYEKTDLEGLGIEAQVDLGWGYLAAQMFAGRREGEAKLTATTLGVGTTTETDVSGDFVGAGIGLGWDGYGYRGALLDVSVAPEIGVRYVREEVDDVEGAPFDLDDLLVEVVGYGALALNSKVHLGAVDVVLGIRGEYLFGDLQGWGAAVSVGASWRF